MTDSAPPHALITASRVNGTPVFNAEGDRIGHIEDLSIDKVSGQVRYALLAFGGLLGIGERIYPLPWSELTYHPDKHGYVVRLAKADIEKADSYAKDDLESFGRGEQGRPAPFL